MRNQKEGMKEATIYSLISLFLISHYYIKDPLYRSPLQYAWQKG